MRRFEYEPILKQKYPDVEIFSEIFRTFRKIEEHIGSHERISISVSGGSDSDCIVHLICEYFSEYLEKCRFVFVNTGLEYDATKRHLCDLETRYGIRIDRIRGMSVVTACRKYGFPIINKMKSYMLGQYVDGKKWPVGYIFGDKIRTFNSLKFTDGQKQLALYLKENNIKVSKECCSYSKKKPLSDYQEEHHIDLIVTGERKAEGGQRAIAHESCFEEHKDGMHKYMPLWWWSNTSKAAFKNAEGIRYSDCYEVYGMKRTGCCGCPFNLNIADDLQTMYRYEPMLYRACMAVFGQSYDLMDRFHCRRKKCLPEFIQLTFDAEENHDEKEIL